ncbi:MAG: TetR/AcrR family transcriptional regulator [Actinomycetaceae bacterium]|nr:TetR/AcrR family transcriptional regulator [Actinomycetaceae bacterium]
MRRTAEDAERTRLALLEAALIAFEKKGWRGATFEHVAAQAGVTRGALHHHFSSKVALLEAALSWGWDEYSSLLFAAEPLNIKDLLVTYTTLLHNDPRFRALAACTVVVAPQAFPHAEKNAALDSWHDRIASSISPTEGAMADSIAHLALSLLEGLTVTAVMRPHALPQPDDLSASIAGLARGCA